MSSTFHRSIGVLSIPLIMSTGVIGLVQYLGFFFPHLSGGTMPRSIVVSIAAIMAFYLALNIGVVGRTILIIVAAFASIFAGLLGGSRVPFNAARDGLFFSVFAKLHPRYLQRAQERQPA